MSILAGLFSKKVVDGVGKSIEPLINGLVTTNAKKNELKNGLTQIVLDASVSVIEAQKEIILAEAKGNWLQRSWRPIMALSFGFIVFSTYFLFPLINIWAKSEDLTKFILELKSNAGFWRLLVVMVGGYTGGRTVEKIVDKVTKNVDLSFLKRKDRKEKYAKTE